MIRRLLLSAFAWLADVAVGVDEGRLGEKAGENMSA